MTRFLQILLTLGLIAFLIGVIEAFTRTAFLLSPQGYWRGALGLWILLLATRATYPDKR